MKIKYTGPDDARVLDAADIAKSVENSEFRKTHFPKGKAVDVVDDAAQAILDVPEIFGNFEAVDTDDTETEDEAPKAKKSKAADTGAVTETSSASTSDAPAARPSGRASTGA